MKPAISFVSYNTQLFEKYSPRQREKKTWKWTHKKTYLMRKKFVKLKLNQIGSNESIQYSAMSFFSSVWNFLVIFIDSAKAVGSLVHVVNWLLSAICQLELGTCSIYSIFCAVVDFSFPFIIHIHYAYSVQCSGKESIQ